MSGQGQSGGSVRVQRVGGLSGGDGGIAAPLRTHPVHTEARPMGLSGHSVGLATPICVASMIPRELLLFPTGTFPDSAICCFYPYIKYFQ